MKLTRLADTQRAVVARWQLVDDAKSSASRVDRQLHRLEKLGLARREHDGVYVLGATEPTREQKLWAAVLTAPDTALADASAAAFYELWQPKGNLITIVRPGDGGVQRCDGLLIRHSTKLTGNVVLDDGLRRTTPERTIIDLAAHVHPWPTRKLLREAMRRKLVTIDSMDRALRAHRGWRGTKLLRELISFYRLLQLDRCRSDAEARAMEILYEAGFVLPRVNVRRADEEADLSWESLRLIIEVDGPAYHVLSDEDARKTAAWHRAHWRVRRISSDVIFDDPNALIRLAVTNGVPMRAR